MHGNIFQISSKPIDKDWYIEREQFFDNHNAWADYIGDPVKEAGKIRELLQYLVDCMDGVLTLNADNSLTYNGKVPMYEFKKKWTSHLQSLTRGLTAQTILQGQNLYDVKSAVDCTHVGRKSRFYIEGWNGWAGPMKDFVEWIDKCLEKGERIYVGAIIDFHY